MTIISGSNILLPEANIAICMVCQRRILRYCIPRLQYIVILEAKQATIYRNIGDKLEFSISYQLLAASNFFLEFIIRAISHGQKKSKLKFLLSKNFTFVCVFLYHTEQFCLKTKILKLKFLSRLHKSENPAIAKSNFFFGI